MAPPSKKSRISLMKVPDSVRTSSVLARTMLTVILDPLSEAGLDTPHSPQ
jgi:hypothetical protein